MQVHFDIHSLDMLVSCGTKTTLSLYELNSVGSETILMAFSIKIVHNQQHQRGFSLCLNENVFLRNIFG